MNSLLSELNKIDSGIKGSAIASRDGVTFAYSAKQNLDEDLVSSLGAALFCVGERSISNLIGGKIKQITVEGDQGHVLITLPDEDTLLITTTHADADTQAILKQMFSVKEKLALAWSFV